MRDFRGQKATVLLCPAITHLSAWDVIEVPTGLNCSV